MSIQKELKKAKAAQNGICFATTTQKNNLLHGMAIAILQNKAAILEANAQDLLLAQGVMPDAMLDRLRLTSERVDAMANSIEQVRGLQDPVGELLSETIRPNGLRIKKVRVPFGVVAAIYESRPNVTADIAALCIKSGNVCVLRGGKEAIRSNTVVAEAMQTAVEKCGFPKETITFITNTTRESANELMTANGYVDLLIPRGSASLIQACVQNATVPIIETGVGICHLYVDQAANLDMALKILYNGKVQRPSVCNSLEVCLVHESVAENFLPQVKQTLGTQCELLLCPKSRLIIEGTPANEIDFNTEFLDYKLAICIVNSLGTALAHIAAHSSHHSEVIVTEDEAAANRFLQEVDSAAVYHNASTRFTDGGEFGFGCEVGISTQKLGARGPMGLAELTSYKYIIQGNGQIR